MNKINEVDVLDPNNYQGDTKILEIIELIQAMDLSPSHQINKLVVEIEDIKLDFASTIFKYRYAESKYVDAILDKIINHLNS